MKLAVPQHVAIIMDGNGRWAKARGYPRFYGHVRGASRIQGIVKECQNQGVKSLTLYAFSTENWSRPDDELQVLWKLLVKYIKKELQSLNQNNVQLNVLGEINRLPSEAQQALKNAISFLKKNTGLRLNFALSYGSRSEIIDAVKKICAEVQRGQCEIDQITEQRFEQYLWTAPLQEYAPVDLMIRTSGEKRLSNYLLWQCAYAEFDFPETLWPDYTVLEFQKSLKRFSERNRRFGGLSNEKLK